MRTATRWILFFGLTVGLAVGAAVEALMQSLRDRVHPEARQVAVVGTVETLIHPIGVPSEAPTIQAIVAAHRSQVVLPGEGQSWVAPCFQVLRSRVNSIREWTNEGITIGVRRVSRDPERYQVMLRDALNTVFPVGEPHSLDAAWSQLPDVLSRQARGELVLRAKPEQIQKYTQ